MSSVARGELKMAIAAIRANRWRSLLTMVGIIIGIVSVVTVVGIGEGVKQQIAGQLGQFGKDLITVIPGDIHNQTNGASFAGTNLFSGPTSQFSLSAQDLRTIRRVPHVAATAPLSQISGKPSFDGRSVSGIAVIGTSPDLPKILNQKVPAGAFFTDSENDENAAVIGKNVAQRLFQEDTPLGMSFDFRGRTMVVRGVFNDFANVPLSPVANFDNTIFVPFDVASKLANNAAPIYTVLVKPDDPARTKMTIKNINSDLLRAHGGQQDFSVLDEKQTVSSTSHVLDLMTKLIAGIAAISLLVGGVGIMNVMLVSVTERMHEIGVRKAIGATNRQIWRQFMLESGVLSGLGGVIGVLLSLLVDLLLHAYSDLKPSISWQAMVVATLVSVAVGVLFGTAPALKAARKDPIEALRHE